MNDNFLALPEDVQRNQILELVRSYVKSNLIQKNTKVTGQDRISVSGKVIEADEICNMVEAALDGWLTTGRFNNRFEKRLKDFGGIKHCLTVNSGSSANLVAFSALTSTKLGDRAITPGDEVIAVAAGFPTTINPIIQNGCIPVFVDVEASTHNINIDYIESAISSKTKCIMIAHALGNPFDFEKVRSICDRHNLWLVEDCCDALGAKLNGQYVGSLADICTVSFYPAHHITMGEGGAVLTNNSKLAAICESFRDWGRDCFCKTGEDNRCGKRFDWQLGDLPFGYDHKYTYSHLGYNLKIVDSQAACGLAQLDKLDSFINARVRNYNLLFDLLSDIDCIEFVRTLDGASPSWFGFPVIVKDNSPLLRNQLTAALNERLIDTRLFFGGNIIKQPYMNNREYRIASPLDETEKLMNHAFWLGIYPGLSAENLEYVSSVMHELLVS